MQCKLLQLVQIVRNGAGCWKTPPGVDQNGLEKKEAVLEIEIPAGVEHGMQLNMRGKGNDALEMEFLEI